MSPKVQLNEMICAWNDNDISTWNGFSHDADGNLKIVGGIATFFWDAENRFVALSNANGVTRYAYDWRHRRVRNEQHGRSAPQERRGFVYDGWNLLHERREHWRNGGWVPGTDLDFFWGPDLSGTLQGAGGVGGLLFLVRNGATYVPLYDHNGNVTAYVDESSALAAEYTYGAFGELVASAGISMPHRFSTKYYDEETGLYYYGYRFYSPELKRWLNRDPIEEEGGENLYAMSINNSLKSIDVLGKDRYITQFDLLGIGGSGGTQVHVAVAVDQWKCINGKMEKAGIVTFDYHPKKTLINMIFALTIIGNGEIEERKGLHLKAPITVPSTPEEDLKMTKMIREEAKDPPLYNPLFFNCVYWSVGAISYGKEE